MTIKINTEKYISQIDLKKVNATLKLAEYATCKIPLQCYFIQFSVARFARFYTKLVKNASSIVERFKVIFINFSDSS